LGAHLAERGLELTTVGASRLTYSGYPSSPEADERLAQRSVLVIDTQIAQDVLDMQDSLAALEDAYQAEGRQAATSGTLTTLHLPTADAGAWHQYVSMEGGIRSTGAVAIRIRSNIHSRQEVNGQKRLYSYAGTPGKWGGLVFLFGSDDGALRAILNDGHIQHMRVGATCGLSAKYMARPHARVLGILGSGGMAVTTAWAIATVRTLARINVFSPNPQHREAFARQLQDDLGIETIAMERAEDVVRGSDIVSTCTNSHQPVLSGSWLRPGTHVTTVNEHELDDLTLQRVDRYAVYRSPSTEHRFTTPEDWRPPSLGSPTSQTVQRELDLIGGHKIHALPEILVGTTPGRASEAEITCLSSSGTGVQFAALAQRVYERAKAQGRGRPLPLAWFLQDIRS
jgi:ornithine cyclodeaminase/alanine dehydrogenase-like protein (mu-crystallin family)